jgi:hypothetical protein
MTTELLALGNFTLATATVDNLRSATTFRKSHQLQIDTSAQFDTSTTYLLLKFTTAANMRLTTDVINNSLSFINCLTERELDLRGALKRTDATLGS